MITQNQLIYNDTDKDITVYMKREDLIHPFVSGNKYRKLKYNLLQAQQLNNTGLLTFGGAYSNHIAAVAYAAKMAGLPSVGIIRGDELADKAGANRTLQFASDNGMQFVFTDREQYRNKDDQAYIDKLKLQFSGYYIIPEGGTNDLAVRGCEEILVSGDSIFNYICCAVGTGGTIAGLINSTQPGQKVLGFPALKGSFLYNEIRKFARNTDWELVHEYHFGGYAKTSPELIEFMNSFSSSHKFLLDPVYTAKMVFGVMDMIHNGYFADGSSILLIHTGGLQGIAGMNVRLQNKQLPTIKTDV